MGLLRVSLGFHLGCHLRFHIGFRFGFFVGHHVGFYGLSKVPFLGFIWGFLRFHLRFLSRLGFFTVSFRFFRFHVGSLIGISCQV